MEGARKCPEGGPTSPPRLAIKDKPLPPPAVGQVRTARPYLDKALLAWMRRGKFKKVPRRRNRHRSGRHRTTARLTKGGKRKPKCSRKGKCEGGRRPKLKHGASTPRRTAADRRSRPRDRMAVGEARLRRTTADPSSPVERNLCRFRRLPVMAVSSNSEPSTRRASRPSRVRRLMPRAASARMEAFSLPPQLLLLLLLLLLLVHPQAPMVTVRFLATSLWSRTLQLLLLVVVVVVVMVMMTFLLLLLAFLPGGMRRSELVWQRSRRKTPR